MSISSWLIIIIHVLRCVYTDVISFDFPEEWFYWLIDSNETSE